MKSDAGVLETSVALTAAYRNAVLRTKGQISPEVSGSTSVADLESIAKTIGVHLDSVLADAALLMAKHRLLHANRQVRESLEFQIRDTLASECLIYTTASAAERREISPKVMFRAVMAANRAIEIIHDLSLVNDVAIFELLGLRNLSSFMGEVFARELRTVDKGKFLPNPNQDGYPDLCALTTEGLLYVEERRRLGQTSAKQFWSPYPYGGIEVKATCGNTPAASKVPKPRIGESRYPILVSAEWKAHHRDTNNLVGIFWDFIDGLPTVLAVFFRNDLSQLDWGNIIRPIEGGGRTTSVSIMTKEGVKKMGEGWIILPKEPSILQSLSNRKMFNLSNLDQV